MTQPRVIGVGFMRSPLIVSSKFTYPFSKALSQFRHLSAQRGVKRGAIAVAH
ncbi:MAG: hypothetical protein RMX65_012990 [Nostoc sp. DedQUE01]|nr:hypothetical protein [Nostoc sp. DedQUE01]